jgi:hypothetical protein
MHPGEVEPYPLSPIDVAPIDAASDNRRRRPAWRRVVAAAVMGAFTLMLVTLGFTRYAHHPAYGFRHPVPSTSN